MQKNKYIFVAKGIGITPFRSMIQYLLDANRSEKITLFYIVKNQNELLFKDLFEKARAVIGLNVVYLIRENGDLFDEAVVKKKIADITTPIYYLSGPQEEIETYRTMLQNLGAKQIKTDFFSGYN